MTAAAQPYRRVSIAPVLLMLAVVMIVIGVTVAVNVMQFGMDHAVERHGEVAVKIEQCYNQGKVLQKWLKADGRIMYGCEVDGEDFCFAVVVTDATDEIITCIPKEKFKTIDQLERYFVNSGGKVKVW